MNDADVSVNKSTSLVTIFGDDDSHSEINWRRLVSASRSRKGNDSFAIAKQVAQNGLIDNVRSIVGKSQESGLLTLPKASYNVIRCDLRVRIANCALFQEVVTDVAIERHKMVYCSEQAIVLQIGASHMLCEDCSEAKREQLVIIEEISHGPHMAVLLCESFELTIIAEQDG